MGKLREETLRTDRTRKNPERHLTGGWAPRLPPYGRARTREKSERGRAEGGRAPRLPSLLRAAVDRYRLIYPLIFRAPISLGLP